MSRRFSRAHGGRSESLRVSCTCSDIIREAVTRYNFEVFMLWWFDKASLRTGVARADNDQRIRARVQILSKSEISVFIGNTLY